MLKTCISQWWIQVGGGGGGGGGGRVHHVQNLMYLSDPNDFKSTERD